MRILDYFACENREFWLEQIGRSDWAAGKLLYRLLKTGGFHGMTGEKSTVLLLAEGDKLAGYCTYAEKDDVQPTELKPWIGFVFTDPAFRGQHAAGRLIRHAEDLARKDGYDSAYISTGHIGLYEKYGYTFYRLLPDLDGNASRVYRKRLAGDSAPDHMGLKVFHVDCGRKYFSPDDLKDMLAQMSLNGYDAMELAVGNGGWRFLTQDLTVRTDSRVYPDGEVREALKAGNKAFHDCGINELAEGEMEDLLAWARENGIEIIPLLNNPGHMEAVVTALKLLGIENAAFEGSPSSVSLDCPEAVSFISALLEKYIVWFTDRGCRYINLGADEYGNDGGTPGFTRLQREGNDGYSRFIRHVNNMAERVTAHHAIPLIFNDGMYYDRNDRCGTLDRHLVCSYWTDGWEGYRLAPAAYLAEKGVCLLNTNRCWYYVLGRRDGRPGNPEFTIEEALRGIETVPPDQLPGGGKANLIGHMVCLWCDEPGVPYDETEKDCVRRLIAQRTKTAEGGSGSES